MHNDDLWFTTARLQVRLSNQNNARGVSIMEHTMAQHFSPPVHVHYHEDETFYVLDGRVRFDAGGDVAIAGPGETVHIPAGVPHSFLVLSSEGARFLTITLAGFEAMVREASRPATDDGLPAQVAPTPAEQQMLAQACLRNGIELLGPPLAA